MRFLVNLHLTLSNFEPPLLKFKYFITASLMLNNYFCGTPLESSSVFWNSGENFNPKQFFDFFDPPNHSTITLCHVCSREPSCVMSCSAQTPPPFPNKKTKFWDLKRIGVEVKKSLSSFIYFFQLSTNNKKENMFKKQNMSLFCQSLVQTGSILSKTGVHICNPLFNFTKILHWNFYYRDVTDFDQVPPTPLIYHHGESQKMCRPTIPQDVT